MFRRTRCTLVVLGLSIAALQAQTEFVHWETPHVHPLDVTPDGDRLLAVNTADGRLEVFDLTGELPTPAGSVPVGLDPVSVRALDDDRAWVVNQISDSVSVVDLRTLHVVATLSTADEPADVVFAGEPLRAFVSCSQANRIQVFDPADLTSPPLTVELIGEDPRALAVSADGSEVYAAIFESGNATTILGGSLINDFVVPKNVVNHPAGPYGGTNPPPNAGAAFEPSMNPVNPPPPPVSLIVGQDAQGSWLDDNGADWTALVSGPDADLSGRKPGWTLADHDVAIVDATTLSVRYVRRLMNVCADLAVHPTTGQLAVVGTEATNVVRFEPNLTGRFVRAQLALVDPDAAVPSRIVDLNPHLDYSVASLPQSERDRSIGEPRSVRWSADGRRLYVAGQGSNNVVVFDALGTPAERRSRIEVGEGPTGLALDEPRGRLYVLNKFEASVSIVDLDAGVELGRVAMFDPTPESIRTGRRLLYSTHDTSGLGQVACASCHVDARTDGLAWDLGDPSGEMKPLDGQNLGQGNPILALGFEDWHPMKGPMLTQTLQDIIGFEPLHWRGDRAGIEEFDGAFVSLQGDDAPPTAAEMQQLEDFLATVRLPPNPFRNLDNSLPTALVLDGHYTTDRFGPEGEPLPPGDAENGLAMFRPPRRLDVRGLACTGCHTLPAGVGADARFLIFQQRFEPLEPGPLGERHHSLLAIDGVTNKAMKVPQLRTLHERVGFDMTQLVNTRGFGYFNDGAFDSLSRFITNPLFTVASTQEVADMLAFLLAFSGGDLPEGDPRELQEPPGTPGLMTHAAVGRQVTLDDGLQAPAEDVELLSELVELADAGRVGLVARTRTDEGLRSYVYRGNGRLQSDRRDEVVSLSELQAASAPGRELTYTVVPLGSELRIGIDRDADGVADRDELDAGSDPADPDSVPPGE